MKLDKYTASPLAHGRVSIMFTEPIKEGYELSLLFEYFKKHKKKISFDYELKPEVKIIGMICPEKSWINFLKKIHADKSIEAFIESIRPLETVEEIEEHLRKIRNAEVVIAK